VIRTIDRKARNELQEHDKRTRQRSTGVERLEERTVSSRKRLRAARLNAIVDVDAAARAGWQPLDVAKAYVDGGATFLQFRAKTMASGPFLEMAARVAELTRASAGILIVNDRADIARLAGADGVHVGQEDLAPALIRPLVEPGCLVGRSTHTAGQLEAACREPVDYVAIGPVFSTATKDTGYAAVGLDCVRAAAHVAESAALPLVAIGGITLERARMVLDAGASSVAVIGDLLAGGNPAGRVREYLRALGG